MALEKEFNLIYRYLISIGLSVTGLIFMLQLKPVIGVLFMFFGMSEFYMIYKETNVRDNE